MYEVTVPMNELLPPSTEWTLWTAWSNCSLPCGNGTHSRERTCRNVTTADRVLPDEYCGSGEDPSSEEQVCNAIDCRGNGIVQSGNHV